MEMSGLMHQPLKCLSLLTWQFHSRDQSWGDGGVHGNYRVGLHVVENSKHWEQPRCPTVGECLNQLQSSHTVGHCAVTKILC